MSDLHDARGCCGGASASHTSITRCMDGLEQLHEAFELVLVVLQLGEVLIQRLQKQQVVVRLHPGVSHLLAELLERGEVRALRELEHLDHLADLRPGELLVNRVEVRRLVLPKLQLRQRARVLAVVSHQRVFRVRPQHVLDLSGPRDDRRLQGMDLIRRGRASCVRGCASCGRVGRGHRQQRLALRLADGHVHAGDELVHVLHHLARDHLRPPVLVPRVRQHRQEDLLRDGGQMLERDVAKISEDDFRVDVIGVQLDGRELQEAQRLLLEPVRRVHGLRRVRSRWDGGTGQEGSRSRDGRDGREGGLRG